MQNNVAADDLAVFLMVLREGGFRAAAKRLNVAPSKVSATISRIEAQLGVPILRRTTRSLHTTDAGQMLADRIAPLLSGLDAACAEAASLGGRVQGRLRLNVPGAVMPDILPPLLAEYRRRHPGVEVEVMVENGLIDIIAAGFDAGIRYGPLLEQDMISTPIGPRVQQMALAASASYLAARGTPQHPADLTAHDAIRYRLPGGRLLPWMLQNDGPPVQAHPVSGLILDVAALDTSLCYAREGIGIIYTFRSWLEADFTRGDLRPILRDWWPSQDGPHLYYPSRSAPAPLRAFIDLCKTSGG